MTDTEPIPIRLSPVQDVSGVGEADRETETETERGAEEGDTCVVCFEPTTEKSTQLFLYNCRCVYFVHEACFRRWRVQKERIGLFIAGIAFEEDGDEGEPLLRARIIGPRLAEIPVRAVHRPAIVRPQHWFWDVDTEQKMLLVAAACFLLVLLFHLRHTSVVVYTREDATKLLLNTL